MLTKKLDKPNIADMPIDDFTLSFFDRIMITAAVPEVPEPLVKQLANGGFLVGPVGYGGVQRLVACEKRASKLIERAICDVRFVKLLGEYGFEQ